MRVLLIHLDPAAADTLAATLADDGHDVSVAGAPKARGAKPTEVLVVCLDAKPQAALDAAARVGADEGLDAASILFVGGTTAALGEAERRFPTASFARMDTLPTALASMND